MQLAAIDSNSTAPIFTGIPFSSVSSSSCPFQSIQNNSFAEWRKSIWYSCAQIAQLTGTGLLKSVVLDKVACAIVGNLVFMRVLKIALDKQKNLYMRRRISIQLRITLSLAGLGEWLWLMLESRRGLRVQVQ